MPHIEILKDCTLIRRQSVSREKALAGCGIRLGANVKVNLKLGESTQISGYDIRVVDDTDAPIDAPTDNQPGAPQPFPRLEGYEIQSPLGEGGMGTVWKGIQLSTNRAVAIKFLSARAFNSERSQRRFKREVELSAKLEHPNIARIYDSGLRHGAYYYAMELIEGVGLEDYVKQHHPSQKEILSLMKTVCQAVQHAHQRGVVHRDLKPGNIMIDASGQPHVVDFGLAKSLLIDEGEKQLTISIDGDVAGTPAYMSPEQAAGKIDEIDSRTDVFSLGVILYRQLVGQPPHDLTGSRYQVMKRIVEQDMRSPRQLSVKLNADLEGLLRKCLARSPQDRYSTAGQIADDIDNYLHGKPLNARKATALYRLSKQLSRHRISFALGVAGCAVAAILILGLLPGGWIRQRLTPSPIVIVKNAPVLSASLAAQPIPTTQSAVVTSLASLAPKENAAEPTPSPPSSTTPRLHDDQPTRQMLFDGTDVSNWQSRKDGSPAQWNVRDGYMEVNGTGDIVTRQKFRDFTLHVEFWLPDTGDAKGPWRADSGIFLQDRYELQIHDSFGVNVPGGGDCGAIFLQKAPDVNACKPPEQWQTCDITFRAARFDAAGNRTDKAVISVVLNGQQVQKDLQLDGPTSRGGAESDDPGPIRLQDSGKAVRFRNIWIVPTNSAAAISATTSPSAEQTDSAGRQNLFDGTDLANFQSRKDGSPAQWNVRDGYMEVNGTGDIVTKEKFQDFTLHVEFWCPDSGNAKGQRRANSGVFLQDRYELQILDSFGADPPDNKDCGAIWGRKAPDVNACRPPGQWQTFDITFHTARFDPSGNRISKAVVSIMQNGQQIQKDVQLDGPTGEGALESPDSGPIRLQDHGDAVRFRNIWIIPADHS